MDCLAIRLPTADEPAMTMVLTPSTPARIADHVAATRNEVDRAIRTGKFVDDRRKHARTDRRLARRFENDAVAGRQRRCEQHRCRRERVVVRGDAQRHAHRFVLHDGLPTLVTVGRVLAVFAPEIPDLFSRAVGSSEGILRAGCVHGIHLGETATARELLDSDRFAASTRLTSDARYYVISHLLVTYQPENPTFST